jgi:hypothetical protein
MKKTMGKKTPCPSFFSMTTTIKVASLVMTIIKG